MLTILGVLLLAGCVYIPTFGVSVDKTSNLQWKIGDAASKRPIRLNVSTREDVERMFGPPMYTRVDDTQTAYAWTRRWGVVWLPLCFWNEYGYGADDRTRYFLLTYNANHVLTKAELVDNYWGNNYQSWSQPRPRQSIKAP